MKNTLSTTKELQVDMASIKCEDDTEITERAKRLRRQVKAKQMSRTIRDKENSETGNSARLQAPSTQVSSLADGNVIYGPGLEVPSPLADAPPGGNFGWHTIEQRYYIPYFFFGTEKYVSLRIANEKVFVAMAKFSQEVYECLRVISYPLTIEEADLLNEINFRHSDSCFGNLQFNPGKDYKISLEDLVQTYNYLKFCSRVLPQINTSSADQIQEPTCGFIKVDRQSFVPYVKRAEKTLVPIFYFEGDNFLLQNRSLKLSKWEMTYMRFLCKIQQIKKNFYEGDTTYVVDLEDVKQFFSPETEFKESWPSSCKDDWFRNSSNTVAPSINGGSSQQVIAPTSNPSLTPVACQFAPSAIIIRNVPPVNKAKMLKNVMQQSLLISAGPCQNQQTSERSDNSEMTKYDSPRSQNMLRQQLFRLFVESNTLAKNGQKRSFSSVDGDSGAAAQPPPLAILDPSKFQSPLSNIILNPKNTNAYYNLRVKKLPSGKSVQNGDNSLDKNTPATSTYALGINTTQNPVPVTPTTCRREYETIKVHIDGTEFICVNLKQYDRNAFLVSVTDLWQTFFQSKDLVVMETALKVMGLNLFRPNKAQTDALTQCRGRECGVMELFVVLQKFVKIMPQLKYILEWQNEILQGKK